MRIALIIEAAVIVSQTPDFTDRHGVTRADLLDRTMRLEIGEVADLIAAIFPADQALANAFEGLREAASPDTASEGYGAINRTVVEPLRGIAATLKEITAVIAHFYGAYG